MSDAVKVGFVPFSAAARGTLVIFCDDALKLGTATSKALGEAASIVKRAPTTIRREALRPSGARISSVDPLFPLN